MKIKEAKEQLISLKEHCKTMDDEIFKKDVEAIKTMLAEYEKEIYNLMEANELIEHLKSKNTQLKYRIKILENGDLTIVYMNGFYDGEKKWKDIIEARIRKLKVLAEEADDETLNACELDIRKNQIYLLDSLLQEAKGDQNVKNKR